MAFNIDPAVKENLLTERIKQLNLEGYQHELNKLTAEAIGNEQGITEANAAMEIISTAITVAENELNQS